MKTILIALAALVSSTWYLDLEATRFPPSSDLLWIARQQGLYLSGLLSITLMSLCMLLAIRPVWLESPLGGLDRIYRLHKWSGILGISFGAIHWLIKLSGGLLKSLIGTGGRLPKIKHEGLAGVLREFGDDMGEPALYIALAMLVITLWRRFPYPIWRHLHRIMPVLYLMLAFHAVVLAPAAYWTQPVGVMLATFIAIGTISSLISVSGLIGRRRQVNGTISSIRTDNEITEITCRLDDAWQGHKAGQFAFITFSRLEGAHPFTIASADRGDKSITFCIKALGDFTRRIGHQVQVGQVVSIEGPYGRFQYRLCRPDRRQIWVAGGIGVTPFLAWLESFQGSPAEWHQADFHYCTQNRDTDHFVSRLQDLCTEQPGIRLHIHSAQHGERLSASALKLAQTQREKTEIWFCGPSGLANALKKGLGESWNANLCFHQEAFEMR